MPKLASGHLEGYPRVFGVAWAFVAHTDSRFEPELLRRFVNAYQRVQPLTIGELWAVAITLRVVLVENLRSVSRRASCAAAARAKRPTVLPTACSEQRGRRLISPTAVLRRFENKPLERAFAVQLVQRLRDLDPKVGPILLWLDKRLDAQGTTADEIVRAEHQDQTAMTVTVRNIITSMRLMSAFDWQNFLRASAWWMKFCATAAISPKWISRPGIITATPSKISPGARLTRKLKLRSARCSAPSMRAPNITATAHPPAERNGRSPDTISSRRGRVEFERELGYRVAWRRRLLRLYVRAAVPGYLGTIVVLTALILALPLAHSCETGRQRAHTWSLLGVARRGSRLRSGHRARSIAR